MSKPKIGFYWCASCGGCEEAVVDLHESILPVVEAVDIVFWPCAMDFKTEDVRRMADGEMTACFVNGAIRTDEQREMAELLRKKTQFLVAFGSCAHAGGVPGLGNLHDRESILQCAYQESCSTVNPQKVRPHALRAPEGELDLPTLDDSVKTLDQTIDVDYYLPGCPPPVKLIVGAVTALLEGKLPPKGTVLAPDTAMCTECPRVASKPLDLQIQEFKRPHEAPIDPTQCLLAQGFLCLGPATRAGCDAACITGNMPCTGCLGPVSRVEDHGAAAMGALASSLASNDAAEVDKLMDKIVDPVGTFYRYGLPASMLFRRLPHDGNGEVHR